MNTVAVVIPCFNGADFLPEALDSVLRQTRPADEIIVINDGSTDNTADIAASYAGVTVKTVPNGGVAQARNTGMQMATSEWIAFLDHDDIWLPSKLEEQMALLSKSPGCNICVCDSLQRVHQQPGIWTDGPMKVHLPDSQEIGRQISRQLRFNPSALIARRSALVNTGGFDPAAQPCEDWDMWLRLAKTERFCAAQRELMIYRVHGRNTSRNAFRMMQGELRVWDRHVAPSLPLWRRALTRRTETSRIMASVAITHREYNEPHLGIMARSLALWPIGFAFRYKIFLHMLLRKTGLI